MAPTLKNVFGTTVFEFMANAGVAFKGQNKLGDTKYSVSYLGTPDASGKFVSFAVTLSIDSATAHWAGPGMLKGKPRANPDAANRTAIDRVEAFNQAHEQKHIDTYQDAFDAKKLELEKKMVGKTQSAMKGAMTEMDAAMRDACLKLHATEGLIVVTPRGSDFQVDVRPAGAGGCS